MVRTSRRLRHMTPIAKEPSSWMWTGSGTSRTGQATRHCLPRCFAPLRSSADGSQARPAALSGYCANHLEPPSRGEMILSVEKLSKAFQGVQALAPLSFTIQHGITAFIGPNGAGKTTLFNLLSGIYGPSSGSIRHRDEDITTLPIAERARRGIQRTFQNLQIFFRMSALENVMVGASPRL